MTTKKFLSGLALGLLLPFSALADIQVVIDGRAVVFTDVPQTAWYATYVRGAAEAGIVTGYRDTHGELTGKFGPSNKITIAEALKIAVESAGYDTDAYSTKIDSGVDHWASAYVSVAKAEHFPVIRSGISLDRNATRAEVAALITAAFRRPVEDTPIDSRYTDVNASEEFGPSITLLSNDGVVSGDTDTQGRATGTFRPKDAIIRAEVAKIAMQSRSHYGTPGKGRVPDETAMNEEVRVTYGDDGFSPSIVRVKVGTPVVFLNASGEMMWVASNPHPVHTDLAGFDEKGGVGVGQAYTFTFTTTGTFGYHNHLNASHEGTVIVEN